MELTTPPETPNRDAGVVGVSIESRCCRHGVSILMPTTSVLYTHANNTASLYLHLSYNPGVSRLTPTIPASLYLTYNTGVSILTPSYNPQWRLYTYAHNIGVSIHTPTTPPPPPPHTHTHTPLSLSSGATQAATRCGFVLCALFVCFCECIINITYVLLCTVTWLMFSHVFNLSYEIIK